MADDQFLTPDEVRRIGAIPDPPLRNLLITHSYSQLARAMSRSLEAPANWCLFAVWASKQAGQTIRYEDLRQAFWDRCRESRNFSAALVRIATALGWSEQLLSELLREALSRIAPLSTASTQIAAGNLKVYEEIGFHTARFVQEFPPGFEPDQPRLEAFLAALRAGPPPDGQDLLRKAFRTYYRARFATDQSSQAELLLLANLQIGLHEQTRVQPQIAAAMAAAYFDPELLSKYLAERIAVRLNWLSRLIRRLLPFWKTPAKTLSRPLADVVAKIVRGLLTEKLMSLRLADGRILRLGADVLDEPPEPLRQIENAELLALIGDLDRYPRSPVGSGAEDWSSMADRMHYITELFRAFHGREVLAEPPFSAAQVDDLRQGRIPAGPL